MSVLEQMKDMLLPLGIYSLDDNSLVIGELIVYATQLEKLHERLRIMLRECFIATAEDYGISKIEELFERTRPDLTIDERKKRLHLYITLDNTRFSPDSIRHQLRLSGVSDAFTEDYEQEQLTFTDLISTPDPVERALQLNVIEDIVPANLQINIGFTELDWDSLDELGFNFGTLDKMALRFDLYENK